MHAVSAIGMSFNNRWMACQSSDNQIRIYDAAHKLRLNKKKTFKGHMVSRDQCTFEVPMHLLVHVHVCRKSFLSTELWLSVARAAWQYVYSFTPTLKVNCLPVAEVSSSACLQN